MPYPAPSPVAHQRPALPRSRSSIIKHGRSSTTSTANKTAASGQVTNRNLAADVETHHSHGLPAHGSNRRSPPQSPPDFSDDDEDGGEGVRALKQLQEALLSIGVDSATEILVNSTTPISSVRLPPTKPRETALSQHAVSPVNTEPLIGPSEGSDAEYELNIKPPLLLKKSGELVRPALRPSSRQRPSKMPSTPNYYKAVHFGEDLEHVRHFLQVDRPIAVSSGSSPSEANDSESEFPFDDDHQPKPEVWEIEVSNFPSKSPESQTMPVRIERIFLADDNQTLVGTVACADIAPQKLVTCRFTLDYWKTTSEVVAKHEYHFLKPHTDESYDRFCFKIQLAGHENLESKIMLLSVRYNVSGQEHWDGNGPANYQVSFIKKAYLKETGHPIPRSLPRSRNSRQIFRSNPMLSKSLNDGFDSNFELVTGRGDLEESPSLSKPFLGDQRQNTSNRYDFGASLAAAISKARDPPGDYGDIKPKPSLGATHIPITRPNTMFTGKADLQLAEYNESIENDCYFETPPGKVSSNAQMALGDRSDIESKSSSGAAPIPGTRLDDSNTTSDTLTSTSVLGFPASLPAGYDPALSIMPFPSKHKEVVMNERKEVGTNSADINEGITLAEDRIPTNGFVLEREESNFEGSTLLGTDESLTAGVEQQAVIDSTKGTDDYMSMPSNDEDIASQTARQRTEQEILAVKLFSLFFAESEELSHLHETALGKLGPSRFLENYRRILKTYVLKLRVEARTALEKDAVKIIESRGNRRSIAKQIITFLAPENEESVKPLDELAQRPLMKQSLEDWARTVYGLPDTTPDAAPEQAEYSSGESDEEEDDHENRDKEHLKTLTFTNIGKAYHFLRQSVPFQTLILQLRLLGLPTHLREIIETTPKRSIKISAKNDTSFMNRAKGIAEAYTATQWDWWPLAPRVPDTAPDRLRLEWQISGCLPRTYCMLTC